MSTRARYLFRFRFHVQGGHTHVSVYAGATATSLGQCGGLIFRNEEFQALRKGIEGPVGIETRVEFVEEART